MNESREMSATNAVYEQMIHVMREALKEAQHELTTTDGLYAGDLKEDAANGMIIIPHPFQLDHTKTLGNINKALNFDVAKAMARELLR
jgi:hypothetical protein